MCSWYFAPHTVYKTCSFYSNPVLSTIYFINPILSLLTTNKYTVKNSFDLAEEVVNYDHNLYIASLNVELLFIILTSLGKKLSMTYFLAISIVVN